MHSLDPRPERRNVARSEPDAAASVRISEETTLALVKIVYGRRIGQRANSILNSIGCAADVLPNRVVQVAGGVEIAWLTPFERLLLGSPSQTARCRAQLSDHPSDQLLVVSLTDGRAVYRVEGKAAALTLATLTPLDYRDANFGPDCCARTHIGSCRVLVQRLAAGETFRLIVDRSYSGYVRRMLQAASPSDPESAGLSGF